MTRLLLPLLLLGGQCKNSEIDPPPTSDGTGASHLKVAPIQLNFGAVNLGESATLPFSIGNAGTAAGSVTTLDLFGAASGFSVEPVAIPLTLEPEAQTEISVTFTPVAGGALSGVVQLVTDDTFTPYATITLEGSGAIPGSTDTDPTSDEPTSMDVFILFDTAYNYSCYHPDLESFAEDLVQALFDQVDNVAVGLGVYDDYTGLGNNAAASGGRPFQVKHLISVDEPSVLEAAKGLAMEYGGDAYGSGYEAVYQAAMGPGFDFNCNGVFESSTDIAPFQSSPDDLFHGTATQAYDAEVPGVGDRGGVGWRFKARHIVLLSSDNVFRDSRSGGLPEGTCGDAATSTLAADACNAADVKVLGVNVYEYQSGDTALQEQLETLAQRTSSYIDRDGDGLLDDPAVLFGSWNWPDLNAVVRALRDLAGM